MYFRQFYLATLVIFIIVFIVYLQFNLLVYIKLIVINLQYYIVDAIKQVDNRAKIKLIVSSIFDFRF